MKLFFTNIISFIHPEGWKFAAIFLAASIALSFLWMPLAILGYALTFFVVWFFRDPERDVPNDANKIVSSADGKVCLIDEAIPPSELSMAPEKMKRICVFMNVFNVHVNRSPIAAEIENIVYKKGQFLNARSSLVLKTDNDVKIIVVQIAGLIARRILGFVKTGERLDQGERFGLIRFGSRVDIYMPLDAITACKLGDKVTAGETVLASLPLSGGSQ